MKKLLILFILLSSILLFSCDDSNVSYSCKKGTTIILNKKMILDSKLVINRCFYVYDSRISYWVLTDTETYNSYNIGDTLTTILLIKEIEIKK